MMTDIGGSGELLRHRRISRAVLPVILLAVLLSTLPACSSLSYFSQAIAGHLRIMHSRTAIAGLLEDDSTDPGVKVKLALVQDVRAFASEELGLPRNGSYTSLSPVDGPYLGWNVFAAPRVSVEPITWCFPVAGCVVYKGFFSKEKALDVARRMKKDGLDVAVLPFTGYSTLGWYDDPILTSQLRLDTIHLAGLVIHELAHQKLYVPGDSRFNEAFAVTVERAGVLRWLKSTGRGDLTVEAIRTWQREDRSVSTILETRRRLVELYQNEREQSEALKKKASLLGALKSDMCRPSPDGADLPYICKADGELNNAYLVPIDTYYSLVPAFQRRFDHLGGDFPEFFSEMKKLAKLSSQKRKHQIETLIAGSGTAGDRDGGIPRPMEVARVSRIE
jgi:predicted aminopeptidase